jgi:anti-sigma regulatory factor (Ser/Thr protein kinase)
LEDISLHILDIAENSVAAGATVVAIAVVEDSESDTLCVEITDDGEGMAPEVLRKALDPFFTTKRHRRVGLGLSLLKQAAEMAGGEFTIESRKGTGTRLRATFRHSHIDRQPLGDLEQTIETLVIGNPGVDFDYRRNCGGREVSFHTREVRRRLSGKPISSREGIEMVRKGLREG